MVVAVVCGLGASYMTSRLLAERDDKRQRYLNSLIKAVDGDLAATWAEGRAALAGQDGGDGGA